VGARPFQITCGSDVVGRSFPELVEAADAPVIDTSCAALINLSRAVRDHGYKVTLSGEGADEALAGYPWLKVGRILGMLDRGDFRPSNAVRYLALKWFSPGRTWEDANRYQAYIGGPQGISDLFGMYSDARQHFYSPATWDRLQDHIAYEDLDLNLGAMKRWHPLNQALYFGYKTLLPGMLLSHKGDRIAMRNSVEARYPFLDEGVVDFCASVHPRWKLRGWFRDKHLLRTYASSFLPESIWNRPKQIFRAPFAATFFADPPAFAGQLLSEDSLRRTGLFDPGSVRAIRDAYVQGRLRGLQRVFTEMGLTAVMSAQLWHHKYLGGGLCDLPTWSEGERDLSAPRLPEWSTVPSPFPALARA
jgi:asparagine synthase (glutamine-hydrolysing)